MDFKALSEFCENEKIEYKTNELMKEHTSFKIGGPADFFVVIYSKLKLCAMLKKLAQLKIPFFVIGKGTNLLVSDKGIEGVVISLAGMNNIVVKGDSLCAEAGASLAAVCIKAMENSLSGMEFAYGIPASLGGALYMNAGAYEGEMSDVVVSAEYVTSNGEMGEISLEDMALGYRTSIFKNSDMIITNVVLKLSKDDKNKIQSRMDDYLSRRKHKQPLEFPSAGSSFKRPKGNFAGYLIEKNGLKGYSVGGAKVSEKHAGFIINYNNATCGDVKTLIKYISENVYNADSVILEPEIIFVGKK